MAQTPVGAHFVLVFLNDTKPILKEGPKKIIIGYMRLEQDDFYYTEIALTYVNV